MQRCIFLFLITNTELYSEFCYRVIQYATLISKLLSFRGNRRKYQRECHSRWNIRSVLHIYICNPFRNTFIQEHFNGIKSSSFLPRERLKLFLSSTFRVRRLRTKICTEWTGKMFIYLLQQYETKIVHNTLHRCHLAVCSCEIK